MLDFLLDRDVVPEEGMKGGEELELINQGGAGEIVSPASFQADYDLPIPRSLLRRDSPSPTLCSSSTTSLSGVSLDFLTSEEVVPDLFSLGLSV